MDTVRAGWRQLTLAAALTVTLIGGVFTIRGLPETRVPSIPTIAVLGDSYSAGRDNSVVWPTLLAQRTGWSVANFAQPAAGFAADDQGGHAYSYQVDRAEQVHPRAVVIMSGVADAELGFTDAVAAGAADAIGKIKVAGMQALIIGPTWYSADIPEGIRRVADQVREAADAAGVPFLDALDPPWLSMDQMQADLGGITDEGQSAIADKVAAWLRNEVAL